MHFNLFDPTSIVNSNDVPNVLGSEVTEPTSPVFSYSIGQASLFNCLLKLKTCEEHGVLRSRPIPLGPQTGLAL